MEKQIVFAEQNQVEQFNAIAQTFFEEILGLAYGDCFVSDESYLSDFGSCGLPDGLTKGDEDFDELYQIWDRWVIAEIEKRYQVSINKTTISLVDLFNRILQARAASVH